MDINNMQTWHYFAIAGGAIFLLGVILYFLGAGKMSVPSVITSGVGGAMAGLALGVVLMASFGYLPRKDENSDQSGNASRSGPEMRPSAGGGGGPGMMGGGMPKGGPGGGPKGGPGGGFQAPSPRVQLAGLVTALENVADKPVTLTLTDDQRKAIAEQLKGLDAAAEIKDDDAKARLDAILKVVEKDRATLEAVGYRPPTEGKGSGGFGPPKDSPNPFKEGPAHERLKLLLDRLMKK
jgi:hypothetical protein